MITSRKFKQATGLEPEQDDLERCNCPKAGQIGHMFCGWNQKRNLPNFMVGTKHADTRKIGDSPGVPD